MRLWLLPFFFQAVLMFFDERIHLRRGLGAMRPGCPVGVNHPSESGW